MPYSVLDVEQLLLAKLQEAEGIGVCTIREYQGELEQDLNSIVAQWPALFPAYVESSFDETQRRTFENQTWDLFVGDLSYKPRESRRGGANNPGTYAMLSWLHANLRKVVLASGLMPVRITGQEALAYSDMHGISLYVVRLAIGQHYND